MTVIDLIEHEDGSATVHLDLSDEERKMLVQVGFIQILKDSIAAQDAKDLLSQEQNAA